MALGDGSPSTAGRGSFRARLLALSVGILLPAVLCSAWLLWSQSVENARSFEQQLLGTARAISTAVDHKIAENRAIDETLATSGRIPAGEFVQFRERSVHALDGRPGWIVLSDAKGRQVVNTLLPEGAALPTAPQAPPNVVIANASGHSRISDLTLGIVSKRRIIAVDTPVPTPSGVYDLSYIFEPSVFVPLLQDQKLPPGWIVTLLDRRSTVIARSIGHERYMGRPATQDLRDRLSKASEGVVSSRSLDGAATLVAFSRSAATGWTLIVAVPRDEMQAATARSIGRAALLSLALLVVSLVLAGLLARGLSRQVAGLVADASALGEGGKVPARKGLMAELSAVQAAIARASEDLAVREQRHGLMVNELNHRVRNTLATVQALAAHTFRGSDLPAEYQDTFSGRLKALAAAHDLLSEVNWSRTTVADALARSLPLAEDRIVSSGPRVPLSSHAGVALCMVFHELTTNSLKYGALSAVDGHVRIEWTSQGDNCRLTWTETGGPQVEPPKRRGFGTRLIERLLKQDVEGTAQFDYRPEGLVFTTAFSTGNEGRWDPGLHKNG